MSLPKLLVGIVGLATGTLATMVFCGLTSNNIPYAENIQSGYVDTKELRLYSADRDNIKGYEIYGEYKRIKFKFIENPENGLPKCEIIK